MESPENVSSEEFEAAEKLILRWGSKMESHEEANKEHMMIFNGEPQEIDQYLQAVEEIQRSIESLTVSSTDQIIQIKANNAIQIAMVRLEDEFRNILVVHSSNQAETDALMDLSSSTFPSSRRTSIGELNEEDFQDYAEERSVGNNHEPGEEEAPGGGGSTSSRTSSRTSYRSTSIAEIDLIPEEAINDLHSIAKRMVSSGYSRELIQAYGNIRKSVIKASFNRLGVEKLSISDVQRLDWEELVVKIRRWIRASNICIRILFASEKRLCEQIFEGLDSGGGTGDSCFMETVKGYVIQVLNFADAISISKRSPEKLFKILDLHDSLSDLLPDIEAVFESDSSEFIRVQASEILTRLAEAARGILSEFENLVQREPSKIPVPGGTIHPLTRYVMNYISLISDYKQTLIELIVTKPLPGGSRHSSPSNDPISSEMEFLETDNQPPLALHLVWIILNLQFNIEAKSKHYKDPSLPHLFFMNNIHYILQKVKGSPELREMIGDNYLKKLSGKVRQSAMNYQRSTWLRILYCLRDEGLHVTGSFSSGVSKNVLRERFKAFNSIFEEVHRTQVSWLVPDAQLREELRISISEKLIPAYRSFLGRFRGQIENGRHPELYIKYSVEDVETAVLDFFEGQPVSLLSRRRSH